MSSSTPTPEPEPTPEAMDTSEPPAHSRGLETDESQASAAAPVSAAEQEKRRIKARNRRLVRMRQLVEEGEYFSLESMEARAPLLYHQYIGKFEGKVGFERPGPDAMDRDLSSSGPKAKSMKTNEEKARERLHRTSEGASFLKPGSWREGNWQGKVLADMLLQSIDKSDSCRQREEQEAMENDCAEESEDDDDENEAAGSGAKYEEIEATRLRLEFMKLMQERFIQGADTAFFDYKVCDSDSELDDLEQMGRDAEDDYFNDDDDDEFSASSKKMTRAEAMARFQRSSVRSENRNEEDMDY